MKYAKFLVALLAVCTLIIVPALSMPDDVKDCKKQIESPCQGPIRGDIADGQQRCPCPEDKMGPDGDKAAPKSMMDGCDKPMMGPDDKKPMADGFDKPMMGPDDKKPMADGCDRPMMGPDDKKPAPKSMMNGCHKPFNGPDGKEPVPRFMNGPDGEPDEACPCHGH